MSRRMYASNISALWPVAKQLAITGTIAADFVDELDAKQRRSRKPEHLKSRTLMLRPTSRRGGETIVVAALPCLAFGTDDFLDVLTKAAERDATIEVCEPQLIFPPDARHTALQRAAKAFAKAKADAHAIDRGKIGGQTAGQRRAAEAKAKAESIRAFWGSGEFTTISLLSKAGLSYNTAKLYLGSRRLALKSAEAAIKRAERRKAKA